ncbi:hypothetical protein FHG87_022362 [Trinorchestia longiramus]|nr:hypothetical protein FHG87_022362 [Trinorchestia longiramus]
MAGVLGIMFGMNVMAWNGGDLEKLEMLQNWYGEIKLKARCVEEDSGMRYLVGLDKECNMTVVDAMKDFLVHAWNK